MPGHEKLLKKVEQERAKGQFDRALARLKEAIAEDPKDFQLAQEAASLCFGLGRTLEGAGILRSAMKRSPTDRPFALEMLEREFAATKQAELGEILYESYLALPDFDKAREVVAGLAEADRGKLLSKLRTKVTSVSEETPNDAPKLVGLLLAEAVVLSAMQRSDETAAVLEHVLDLDPSQTDVAGRLSKVELRQSPECAPMHLLLARCYVNISKPEHAATHLVAGGKDATLRDRALHLVDAAGDSPFVQQARGEILLMAQRWDEAQTVLDGLLRAHPHVDAVVRRTLESVHGSTSATPGLRLLYAQTLARTGANRLALKEIQEAREAGADPVVALETAEILATEDTHSIDIMLLRARLAVAAHRPDVAATAFQQALAADPGRGEKLRDEIEAACKSEADGPLGRLLVDLYLQLELPQEAADSLRRLRDARGVPPSTLYELSGTVAGQYGFSATLLLVFVEAALETEHEREARAAVAHYLASPGARTAEFASMLTTLLRERSELAGLLARALEGLPLSVELRFLLATASLEKKAAGEALVELEALVLERPELRETALAALESLLARNPESAEALVLAGDLSESVGRSAQAVQYLAKALRIAPAETDRICKVAERVLRREPKNQAAWSEIVLALVDVQRHRHARELCYLAQQALPAEKHGFVHAALGEMLLAAKQQQSGVSELESSLACEDVPLDRVVALLRRAVESDTRYGYARYVLASALLRQGQDLDEALTHLSAAVQQDDLLVDLAFELMAEYVPALETHAPARVLEGLLHLRKGDRIRGVALLDRALELQPEIAPQVLPALEAEWDRDPQNAALGSTFGRALRGAGQIKRACRLVVDLARRFPDRQVNLVRELEELVEIEPLPEVHRALWELLLERGERGQALEHLERAVEATRADNTAVRELLEIAARRMPESGWVLCTLAELEAHTGNVARTEELLHGLLARDPGQWETALECLHSLPGGGVTESLHLLEIDCWLAGRKGVEAVEGLRRFRTAFPATRDAVLERYRLVVAQQSAGIAAEHELGSLLREAGRIEEAVSVLETGLQRGQALGIAVGSDSSSEREIRLTLASLYVELGRESEGRDLLASVLDRPGDHQETYGFLERLARQGMLSRLKNLRETISSYPGNLRARLELARLSIVSLDFEGAREALSFTGDSAAIEATRRYLLARSHADEDHTDLALAVLRSIELDDVADEELRRNVVYLKGVCCEQLSLYGEAHALFLQILSEFPYFKDTRERVRRTYQKHLESALEPRAEVLEKRTHLDVSQ